MPEPTTLGTWLRRERERRGVTLSQISEQTKVSVPLLAGLEADDLSRWPGGIFRRSFARSYATAIGLDADLVVKRIEEEHPDPAGANGGAALGAGGAGVTAGSAGATSASGTVGVQVLPAPPAPVGRRAPLALRERLMAIALDLLVAAAIAFGFAAAGSELLWPVLAIAAYHALGVLLSGTTPMLAIVAAQREDGDVAHLASPQPAAEPARRAELQQPRRHRGRRPVVRAETRLDRH